jgi:predicted SnoaL-like aldol condensation-catalyzing enzyme
MTRHRTAVLAIAVTIAGAALAAQQFRPPEAPAGNDLHIYFTEGDQVVKIAQRWLVDPSAPGSFYETFEWDQSAARVIAPSGVKVPATGCTATAAQLEANKKTANAFWRNGLTPPERIALVDQGYIQHNPFLRRFALMYRVPDYAALTFFATRAGEQRDAPPIKTANGQMLTPQRNARVIGACDVVMQVHRGYTQNPPNSGTWVEQLTWDLFRVRDGKLVEHWDGTGL